MILLIFNWKVKIALSLVYVMIIINYRATNNITETFKNKEHKNKILLININLAFVVFILLLVKVIELMIL